MGSKKARDRKRQTQISFSPAAKPSPANMGAATSQTEAATPTKSPKPTSSGPAAAPFTEGTRSTVSRSVKARSCKPPKKAAIDSSSEDDLQVETDRGIRLDMPGKNIPHGMFGSSDVVDISSDTSEEEVDEAYTKTKPASRKRRRARQSSLSENEEQEVKAKPASRKRRRVKDSSDSGNEEAHITVVKTKRSMQHSPEAEDDELLVPPSKRIHVIRRHPTLDKDEVVEQTLPRSRRDQARHQAYIEDGEEEQTPPRAKRRKASRRQASPSEQEEESSPPRSKRRRTAKRPATPDEVEGGAEDEEEVEQDQDQEAGDASDNDGEDGDENNDLQADLAFLKSSPLQDRGKLRSAHDKPKNQRQKALEALKRRRAGTNEPSSSAIPSRARRIVVETDSDSELEIIKEEPGSDVEVVSDSDEADEDEPDRDANVLDMFQEDRDDEGFIDDDVDAIIGEPTLGPDDFLPLVLARLTSSKPKELFKYAIEWMVMKKIHPAFDSSSDVYELTFRKLDDEVKGLANSKFSSSVWTPDFTRAIRARPDLMIMEISRAKSDITDAYCEACNRKNHPASDEIMLTGLPYDIDTLEPLDNDSDNSDSDDNGNLSDISEDSSSLPAGEKRAYNSIGERLPSESRRFTLGSTCSANAQVAHTLHHWRYHLYSWVRDYLARENHLTAEMLVKRDGWSDRKREKAALKIVKVMEETGEIGKLYHLYKDQVKYAVEAQHDQRYRSGWKG